MNSALTRLRDSLVAFIWKADLRSMSTARRFLFQSLRLLFVVSRELLRGELNLRAMGLVYTTLLSLVPLLAVTFSVLKAFGAHRQIEPLLLGFMEPLGKQGAELVEKFVGLVEALDVGVLGTVGVCLLIYTSVSLVRKVEEALNFIWHVESARSFGQHFGYMGAVVAGPLLVLLALGITATLMSTAVAQRLAGIEPFGTLLVWSGKLSPYLLVWIAFAFIYAAVPNTRVRIGPAALSGLVAGMLWQTSGLVFATFIASSNRYTALYSSFAVLIVALIWIYLNWVILLLGGQIGFLIQNPRYLTIRPVRLELSNQLKERLAITIMFLVGHRHYHHRAPWTLEELVAHLELPAGPVYRMLMLLKQQGYLEQTANDPPAYLPARAIETVELGRLLSCVRRAEETRFLRDEGLLAATPVDDLLRRVKNAVESELAGTTLKDLILQQPETEIVGRAGEPSTRETPG